VVVVVVVVVVVGTGLAGAVAQVGMRKTAEPGTHLSPGSLRLVAEAVLVLMN